MKNIVKNDLNYQKARDNLIALLLNDMERGNIKNDIIQKVEKYWKCPDVKDAENDIILFKKYFKIENNKDYSMLQLGLEHGFDTSTVCRRIDNILDFIIRYDIISQNNRKLLFDIFDEPFDEVPAKYRFAMKENKVI